MSAVLPQPDARANKNLSAILQGLAAASQTKVAEAMGVSESVVSRMKEKELPETARFLAACKLKVVPEHFRCVDPAYLQAILTLAKKHMDAIGGASELSWDE